MLDSPEVERSVLACCMTDQRALEVALSGLRESDFTVERNRMAWGVVVDLADRGEGVSSASVGAVLSAAGGSWHGYIAEIEGEWPDPGQIGVLVGVLRDCSTRRAALDVAREIAYAAKDANVPISDLVAKADDAVNRLTDDAASGEGITQLDWLAYADAAIRRTGKATGLQTDIPAVNEVTNGMQSGQVWVLAGRPSSGKSAMAAQWAIKVAKAGGVVVVNSLEMQREEVALRILAGESGVEHTKITLGGQALTQGDRKKLLDAAESLKDAPLVMRDKPSGTVDDFLLDCRRVARERRRIDLAIVDYLQLMEYRGRAGNREQEVAYQSRMLKKLAMVLDVPVIAISQLNRSPDAREDKRPRLSDLRESGAIEQDADVVMFVFRPENYATSKEQAESMRGKVELIIAKNRNGELRSIKCHFDGPRLRFKELTERYAEVPY